MSSHLGYDKHAVEGRNGGNSRNGTRTKTVITEVGPMDLEVPRDRDPGRRGIPAHAPRTISRICPTARVRLRSQSALVDRCHAAVPALPTSFAPLEVGPACWTVEQGHGCHTTTRPPLSSREGYSGGEN